MTEKTGRVRPMRKFTLPPGMDCREVIMREMLGYDDETVAVWLERKIKERPLIAESPVGIMNMQTTEEVRCSLVAVDGARVNLDGIPFKGMDDYNAATKDCLVRYYRELNRVDGDAIKKSVESAEMVTDADLLRLAPLPET